MAKSRDLLPQEQRMIRLVDFYRGRCAKSTAFKWINEGRLRAYRLGRMTFVDETFDEFVTRQAAQRLREALQRQSVAKQGGGLGSRLVSGIGWRKAQSSRGQAESIAAKSFSIGFGLIVLIFAFVCTLSVKMPACPPV